MTEAIDPINKSALAERKATVDEVLKALKERVFELEDVPTLTENLNYYHAALKAAEGELKELLAPILRDERNARAAYKPLLDATAAVKDFLTGTLSFLELKAQQAKAEQHALAAEAAAAGDHDAMVAALEAAEAPAVGGTRKTLGWAFEIVDKAAVPELYKVVDESLVKKAAKAFAKSDTPPTIPGIVFKRDVKVAPAGGKK